MKPRLAMLALALAASFAAVPALGEDAGRAPTAPLPTIPRPTPTALPLADAASVADLDAWLAKLVGADADQRKAAAAAIEQSTPAMVPAIAKKLGELKKSANREALSTALANAKKRAGAVPADDDDEQAGKHKKKGEASGPDKFDWFERVMAAAKPGDAAWRDLASIMGLSRMLARIGTAPAAREIIGLYAGFGDVLRVDVQRLVGKLADRSVAALIDARHGESKPLRAWAQKQLDVIGKAVPGEAVQTSDNQVLADVLRAYGRARDIDASRVIVSFANSDRVQVRDAAREAVGMLGENALWQLRESYEGLVGKKPPEDWGWERTAVELFAAYDRSRLAEVYALMDEGLAAQKAGKLDAMANDFDRVLARAPTFDRRGEMVAGYYDLAVSVELTDRPRALAMLRKAQRLDPAGPRAATVSAEVAYLEAEDLASRGVLDTAAYKHVLELDPTHARARAALDRMSQESEVRDTSLRRYASAGAIALAALIGVILLLGRRRRDAAAT